MKKLLFTLFGLLQAVLVMAAAPALSGTGNGDQKRQPVAKAADMRQAIKPWLIVAVNGEGILPEAGFGGPKGIRDAEFETPLHHKGGRPKIDRDAEYETPLHHRGGRPTNGSVYWDATPVHK